MNLEKALELLKKIVNLSSDTSANHMRFDLTLISASERPQYELALYCLDKAIKEGKITKDEAYAKVGL